MGRLTDKTDCCFLHCAETGLPIREDCPIYNNCFARRMYEKLAHYEDLEEQGRLIELPCAINTELYFVGEKADGTYGVYSTTLFTLDLCKSYEGKIGKGFYLTEEEAEAKLKELEGDKE